MLVVEDNADAAESLREILVLQGHSVEVAHDGAEGLRAAERSHPEALLCDIGLPDMDGYEVARAVRANPELKNAFLIALTGCALPEDQARAAEVGFDEHLPKPPESTQSSTCSSSLVAEQLETPIAFQNHASQLIVTQCEVESAFCPPQNIGVKRVAGIETLIRYQIGPFGGDFWHSYEYSMDNQPLLGTAQNKLGLGGHYDYRNYFTLALRARFTSDARGLALDAEQNQFVLAVPKYFTLDLSVLAKNLAFAGVNWDLSFSIFNILNRENFYVNPLGPNPNRYLAGGREYFGQVRIRYRSRPTEAETSMSRGIGAVWSPRRTGSPAGSSLPPAGACASAFGEPS